MPHFSFQFSSIFFSRLQSHFAASFVCRFSCLLTIPCLFPFFFGSLPMAPMACRSMICTLRLNSWCERMIMIGWRNGREWERNLSSDYLTLCEATARSTKLRKKQSYKSVFYQKKEELLLITTLPCLKVFVSLITKNKSKSSWYTEKFAKRRLKEKSSGRMRTKRQNRKEFCFLRCFSSSPGHWLTSKLPQEGRVLSDRKINLQITLSSRSQLESSAGKPFTSSSANQTSRLELRTTPLQGARMEGSATSEDQNDNFFYRTKVFSKRQHDRLSFSCMHAKNGDAGVTITTKKQGWSAPKSLSIEIDRWPHKGFRPAGSDPRVGYGLAWNPWPMAIKYTFLDRMQRF